MIFVIATIEGAEGQRSVLMDQFRQIVPTVLQEQGCLEYSPSVDLETSIEVQDAARKNTVTVVEKWASLEDLEAHLIAPHMIQFRSAVKEIVRNTTIRILEPAA